LFADKDHHALLLKLLEDQFDLHVVSAHGDAHFLQELGFLLLDPQDAVLATIEVVKQLQEGVAVAVEPDLLELLGVQIAELCQDAPDDLLRPEAEAGHARRALDQLHLRGTAEVGVRRLRLQVLNSLLLPQFRCSTCRGFSLRAQTGVSI